VRLLFEQEHAATVLRCAGCRSQPATSATDYDHVEIVGY
jgi:hypothetical protein